jgi:hypothetical protein
MESSGLTRLALRKHLLSDQGSYFMVQNPTPGTGFAAGITTSYSALAAFITLFNGAALPSAPGGNYRRIYLDYIRLICSAAGASTTSAHAVCSVDNGNRYVSGTASTPAPVSPNMDTGNLVLAQQYQTAVGVVQVGPLVASAATAAVRLAGRAVLRVAAAPCWIAFDELVIHFGDEDLGEVQAVTPTTAIRSDVWMPPIIIGPQQTFLFQPYNVANAVTPPSFEYEVGWWER